LAQGAERKASRVPRDPEVTRLAALKRGEVDIAYSIRSELAEELQHTKGLAHKPAGGQGTFWIYFADQWDPTSPWHDQRVRRGEPRHRSPNHQPSLDARPLQNHGQHHPGLFEYYWPPQAPIYDPVKAMKGGAYVYGSHPDVDALFQEQASELDRTRREATLHKIQEIVHERAIFAHLWQLTFLNGVGPRVGESGLGLIPGHAYSAPYEGLTLA